MNKLIIASDDTEVLIGSGDVITLERDGERISTGARAFRREGLGEWVSIDTMVYHTEEEGTREYVSVNVSAEHAREFALAILRELETELGK